MTAIQLSLIKLGDDKSKFKFRMYSNARAPELLLFIIRCLGRRDREETTSKNRHKVEAFKFIGKVQYSFVRLIGHDSSHMSHMSCMTMNHSLWSIMSDEPKEETLLTVRAKEIEFLNTIFAETKSWVTKSGNHQNIITIIFRDFEEMAARLRSVHKNLIESCLKNVNRQIENYSPPEMDFWINRYYFNMVFTHLHFIRKLNGP